MQTKKLNTSQRNKIINPIKILPLWHVRHHKQNLNTNAEKIDSLQKLSFLPLHTYSPIKDI